MGTLLGIDLGTSSIKIMLFDTERGVIGVEAKAYDVEIPKADYAEQNPKAWWAAAVELFQRLKLSYKDAFEQIVGIGLTGQMHGLVTVDQSGIPVRPAILWLDKRSAKEVDEMNEMITESEQRRILHNRVFPGFAFPSLLWVKNHEPENYQRIAYVMQPKDYIRYRLTGCLGTDVSDASATAAFDVGKRRWAWELIDRFHISRDLFAQCRESDEIAGTVTKDCAASTGLKEGIPVIYGCGDQMAQSIGNGVIREGRVVSNIGTGGQISAYSSRDIYDASLRTHTFCHALNKAYTVYGATLCCGMSLKWLTKNVLKMESFDVSNDLASQVQPGSGGVIYLPYLAGERTPVMDTQAKGILYGLQLEHDRRHVIRSVMEGMVFSLKDSLLLLESMGIQGEGVIASGGGAASSLLLQLQADIFEKEIQVCSVEEQACLGACILAGVGTGLLKSIEDACRRFVTLYDTVYEPNRANRDVYRQNYELYQELYSSVKHMTV